MAGFDKATQRVIAVIALMILAAWSLRGYVPGAAERSVERGPPESNPAALAAVVAMLTAAVAIIGFAIIVRLRDRRPRPPSAGALPRSPGTMGRPTWRFSLIALAAVIAWLLLIVVLSRVAGPEPIEPPPHAGPDTDPAPGVTSSPARLPDEVDGDGSGGSGVVEYLIPPMLILMGLVMLGTAIAARRQRRGGQPDAFADEYLSAPAARKATDSLARAAEIGLAEIGDLSREPREAIIACYAAMERELTRVPGAVPQDCDTPTEVLARAVDRHALPADSATELVELFEEARFSPHVMTEAHRDAAVRVLHRVLAELAERVPEVPA
ncbi:DUF4129 domain-containing protein [Mycolicibacterium pulveris]|uniref:Protein-glutamine gamma-glutamyltransferase-like C-terminal domain-containing protein n=1 Tax=Mycolicibacterium pulveris TaxID=36813 RepID=A0A7I7UIK0_MYCPV|nr:DUF4129 domain-containing protein [Mycolicibacterium pulveris]MCV6979936.1 DUF4129 domain-containing protein [Mycolicibacterium pulveris]BBY81308.1 hypothetical protein MPUL_24660 [Mycolicibacterium pulveris]